MAKPTSKDREPYLVLYNEIEKDGALRINKLVEEKTIENHFLEFKSVSNANYSGRRSLFEADAKNYGKAISAFGNSEGGLVVWGIKTGSAEIDFADSTQEISSVSTLASLLNGFTSMLTVPTHNLVSNDAIFTDKAADRGFVITRIPRATRRPIQSVYKNEHRYYIRAGSASVPATHGLLAGLFGEGPQSEVFITLGVQTPVLEDGAIHINATVILYNRGENVARDINGYVELSGPGTPSISGIGPNNTHDFEFHKSSLSGIKVGYMSKPGYRLGIEQEVAPIAIQLKLRPSFNKGMRLEMLVNCTGQTSHRISRVYSAEELNRAYVSFLADEDFDIARALLDFRE